MKKITVLTLALFTLLFACKKDSYQPERPTEVLSEIEQDPIFLEWGMSINGRWTVYSFSKVDKKNVNKENFMTVLTSAIEPVYFARTYYKNILLEKYGSKVENFNGFLDTLYKRNYDKINNSLQKLTVMNDLYLQYQKLPIPVQTSPTITVSSVGECAFPRDLSDFYKLYIDTIFGYSPNSGLPTNVQNCQTENINLFSSSVAMLSLEYVVVNGNCGYYISRLYDAMNAFFMCDPLGGYNPGGNSPTDPFPSGGGGGGSGGGSGTVTTMSPTTINIKPCADSIVKNIKAAAFQVTGIANIFYDPLNLSDSYEVGTMLSTVMNNPNYQIVFSSGSSQPGTNASTSSSALYPVTTELQNSYLNSATALSVARTIIHETVHAYFQYGLANLQNDPNFANFQTINLVLFDTNGNPQSDRNLAQHNQMALKYVNGIASMLVTYANNNGIISPDANRSLLEYCTDLSWAGLFSTNAYQSLPQADQARINDVAYKEQENLPGSTTKKACQ